MHLALSTDRIKVRNVIEQAFKGEILIPEFQREFVWKAEDIKELLTSILGGYFIGTILLYQNTIGKIEFAVKPLPALENEELNQPDEGTIVKIILDGQQRLNSILYSVTSTIQTIQTSRNPHRFFLHIPSLIVGDIQDCIIYATENKSNRKYREILSKEYFSLYNKYREVMKNLKGDLNFLTFLEREKTNIEYINLSKIFDGGVADEIIDEIYDNLRDILGREASQKIRSAFRQFLDYEIFYILVPQEATLEDVVEIFERINKTSYKLSTTDLLFAKFYKEGLNKQTIESLIEDIKGEFLDFKDLKELDTSLILKVLALLLNKEPKPKQLITLTAKDFEDYKNVIENALRKSLLFLRNDLGATSKNIAYTSMLVPLIGMFAYFLLQKEQPIKKKILMSTESSILRYIKQWYFSNVFAERYDEGAATKSFQDFKNFKNFIGKILEKGSVLEHEMKELIGVESIYLEEFLKPKAKNSALFRGFISLLVLNEVRDFITGEKLTPLNATDEHIFPKRFFDNKQNADVVLNRTLSTSDTNKLLKGAQKPSEFFGDLEGKLSKVEIKQILKSHFINERAFKALKRDDFNTFIRERLNEVKEFILKRKLVPESILQDIKNRVKHSYS